MLLGSGRLGGGATPCAAATPDIMKLHEQVVAALQLIAAEFRTGNYAISNKVSFDETDVVAIWTQQTEVEFKRALGARTRGAWI